MRIRVLLPWVAGVLLTAALPHLSAGAEKVKCDKYHTYEELTSQLRALQSGYPDLAKLTSAGKSIQGRELWVMEVTNRKTGAAEEKPGIFVAGSLQGDEPVGTEVALKVVDHLLGNYANDPRLRQLVDTRTFYVWPSPNPDASDRNVRQPGKAAVANMRPTDEDRDGRLDEDGAEDLDKDGFIAQMRVKDEQGDYVASAQDPRIMLPRPRRANPGVAYRLYTEGSDNDGDGAYNEDGPGGVMLNANFPAGWKLDAEVPGSGMYPGSEPETEAILHFLTDHPNVALLIVYQSGEGVLYRPFDSIADKEIPRLDREVYELFGRRYRQVTGKAMTHGFAEAATPDTSAAEEEQSLRRTLAQELPAQVNIDDVLRMGNIREMANSPQGRSLREQYGISQETIARLTRLQELRQRRTRQVPPEPRPQPRCGTLLDWAYKDYCVYALSPSVWSLPQQFCKEDSGGRQLAEELGWIDFLQQEWQGKGFVPWHTFHHPQLGEVEVGGWVGFYRKNPPPGKWLEKVCAQQAAFVVEAAELTPLITIAQVEVVPLQILGGTGDAHATAAEDGAIVLSASKGGEGNLLLAEVKVTVQNTGAVGTRTALGEATRYAQQPPRAVLASLQADGGPLEILSMPKVLRLGNLQGKETKNLAVREGRREPAPSERRRPGGGEKTQQEAALVRDSEPDKATGTWLVNMGGGVRALQLRVVAEKAGVATRTVQVRW
ncbi:MAG: M14 family metallopeptidase [bacterium]|nr:M14 family metallopeptidase [candidate division KSB1 bacterium]MDH7560504.1 M14 family metallopeptidase [bacterium]